LRRLWIPLLVLAVVVAGGFTVSRLHAVFGSEKRPTYGDTQGNDTVKQVYNPKKLVYEVFGAPGTVADISYFDVDGTPKFIKNVTLPWSLENDIAKATAFGNLMAQGDTDTIGCRILVNNEVKVEKISNEVNAFTSCVLQAA